MDLFISLVNVFIMIINLALLSEIRNIRMEIMDLLRNFYMQHEKKKWYLHN